MHVLPPYFSRRCNVALRQISLMFWGQFVCFFDPTAVSWKFELWVLIAYPASLCCRQPAGRSLSQRFCSKYSETPDIYHIRILCATLVHTRVLKGLKLLERFCLFCCSSTREQPASSHKTGSVTVPLKLSKKPTVILWFYDYAVCFKFGFIVSSNHFYWLCCFYFRQLVFLVVCSYLLNLILTIGCFLSIL